MMKAGATKGYGWMRGGMRWGGLAMGLLLTTVSAGSAQAGNVSAKISGGSLFLYGDRTDNTVLIESNASGQIRVVGGVSGSGEATTINGSNAPVDLQGWNNGIYAYLYEGNDSITLLSGNVLGTVHLDLGAGDDDVVLGASAPELSEASLVEAILSGLLPADPEMVAESGSLELQRTLVVLGVQGNDQVTISNSTVRGRTTLDLGGGNDNVFIGTVADSTTTHFQDYLVVVPGSGQDAVLVNGVSVARDLLIDDPSDASDIGVFDTEVGQNLFVFSSLGADNISINNVLVASLAKVIAKEGDDYVSINNLMANRMELFLGIGNDLFEGSGIMLDRLWTYLESGDDRMDLSSSQVNTQFVYGAGGNDSITLSGCSGVDATVYGDGGTDTLSTPANGIQNVRFYSIENRL
jgi:hypothetical protein